MGRHITTGGEDDVGVETLIVASPVPDSDTFGAVLDGLFHVEELEVILLICNDNIHIVDALEAVVRD